ncbi:hypothetical protein NE237_005898 [Protea cynaroides]|uniref:Uncharacterized protein n=1 Tax=Protea cynaroides TaxID=273540 RepID=A0A9Q0KLL0_9MAGN|nr:hypothetical protein NE237_005898 [Protea cynaroides]
MRYPSISSNFKHKWISIEKDLLAKAEGFIENLLLVVTFSLQMTPNVKELILKTRRNQFVQPCFRKHISCGPEDTNGQNPGVSFSNAKLWDGHEIIMIHSVVRMEQNLFLMNHLYATLNKVEHC